MSNDSTVTVSEAQANLPRLLKRDTFAISRHGKVVGFYLSRDRIEALVETMELVSDPEFMKALREYETGRMKFRDIEQVEKAWRE
ncbi:MAG: antitoxin YefM [Verrucomicrobiota bacterium]